jgi:hypothetical protein
MPATNPSQVIDTSLDNDFGEHSVSQVLKKRLAQSASKKAQPWKGAYVPAVEDIPQTNSLHEKPWYRAENLLESYEDHSGA